MEQNRDEKRIMAELNGEVALTAEEREREQFELLKRTICRKASDDEFKLFLAFGKHIGLDPVKKEIYPVFKWDSELKRNVMTFGITIDGYRVLSARQGKVKGIIGPYWCGPDGEWREIWLPAEPPAGAKVGLIIQGFTQPVWGVAVYTEFVQYNREGKVTQNWQKMPAQLLSKCAEAQAHRRANPVIDNYEYQIEFQPDVKLLEDVEELPEPEELDDDYVQAEDAEDDWVPEPPIEQAPKPPSRPALQPKDLKEMIGRAAKKYEDSQPDPQMVRMVAAALSPLLKNDRHSFQEFLVGTKSLTECTTGQIYALNGWLKPSYNDMAGRYDVDPVAIEEIGLWNTMNKGQ